MTRMKELRALVALATVALAAIVALGFSDTARAQDSASVNIVDFGFNPGSVTITAGGTVTWTNTGNATHTVTADDGTFDSGDLASGDTYSFTFDTPGTYTYHCSIHSSMTAEVIVTEASSGNTSTSTSTNLPSTGVGPATTHGAPTVLLVLALALLTGGLLVVRRRPAR